jgi:dTDP-4-dehydrorhamnose reductase
MKLLITGAEGQLGRSLQEALRVKDLAFLSQSHKDLDITDLRAVEKVFSKSKPDVILNAAAYTNVEHAELDPKKAFLINDTGARNLAIVARETSSRLIHFSTDYVFSGINVKPWQIDDEAKPLSVYGKSKLAGEIAIMEEFSENSLIIRTSWLYSPYGDNFYKKILKLALSDNNPLNVVNDQFGQPTNAEDLSNLVISALYKEVFPGIYHGANSGATTWYDFAVEIFKLAGAETDRIKAICTKDYKTKVSRPEYSVLENSKWETFGIKPLVSWEESVERAFPAIRESMSK